MRIWIAIGVLAACSKSDPGPSCAVVMDHVLAITKQQLVGHDDMVLGQRDAMIGQCEARKLSAEKRHCLIAAKTLTEIAACKAGDASAAPFDPKSVEKPRKPRPPRARE